eukprot:6990784-Heterocapsa_arctica.AAC.1
MLTVLRGSELPQVFPEPIAGPAWDLHARRKITATLAGKIAARAEAPPRGRGGAHVKTRAEAPHKGKQLAHLVPPVVRNAYKGKGVRVVYKVQIINNNARDGNREPNYTTRINASEVFVFADEGRQLFDPEDIRATGLVLNPH